MPKNNPLKPGAQVLLRNYPYEVVSVCSDGSLIVAESVTAVHAEARVVRVAAAQVVPESAA
jgi:hypothetical protein